MAPKKPPTIKMSTSQQIEMQEINKGSNKTKNSIHCKTIEEFIDLTEDLIHEDIKSTRYTIKYNNQKGELELKTTNNFKVYKYKSDGSSSDLQKMERLNNFVLRNNVISSTSTSTTSSNRPSTTTSTTSSNTTSTSTDAAPNVNHTKAAQQQQQQKKKKKK